MNSILTANLASALYTDMYQLSMSRAHFKNNRQHEQVAFDYFFRKQPYGGGFTIASGLGELLQVLQHFRFSNEDLDWLQLQGYEEDFLSYLQDFSFRGTLYSVKEGEVVFPLVPLVRVEGTLIEAQLIETILLNYLNFPSLIATKAARIKLVARGAALSEFGLRRAQSLGGIFATRAALTGGFNSTSNVLAARLYNMPASGTMAHAYIQSYDNEIDAFRAFAKANPEGCVLLVDTYDTLKSGVPNAITVAKEMAAWGVRLTGIRLDSGDLAYLSRQARQMLDKAGLTYVKIVVSNQLDEYVIKSLFEQEAPIDVFGVGTSLVTGHPDAALDGVYKLCYANNEPRLKLSENIKKTTFPGLKEVYRFEDAQGDFMADALELQGEEIPQKIYHPTDPEKTMDLSKYTATKLLEKVMENGEILLAPEPVTAIAAYASERLSKLPAAYKRFENPHVYKVGLSEKLLELRNSIRQKYRETGS